MIITKGIRFKNFMLWTTPVFFFISIFMGIVVVLYYYEIITVNISWLPVSVIGTAVAFYVGFKNNQAYDRLWEARKAWGGIINDSRSWAIFVNGYITNQFTDENISEEELKGIKKRLIYRHIGWIYTLRSQLLVSTPWEHSSQEGRIGKKAKYYQKTFGVGLVDDELTKTSLKHFLPESEYDQLINKVNTAAQIINNQSEDLKSLRKKNIITDLKHIELMNVLKGFYTSQGANERIKKFPLPRQYATMSRYFVFIFIFILPFSTVPKFMSLGGASIWLSIPFLALIGWVYMMMENVGDYSENPFQGMANDIPTMSLCRGIEIDLREMLSEIELPTPIEPKNGVLM